MKLTPKYSYRAMERLYRQRLERFTKAMVKSLIWWLNAEVRKQGLITEDADPIYLTNKQALDIAASVRDIDTTGLSRREIQLAVAKYDRIHRVDRNLRALNVSKINDLFKRLEKQWKPDELAISLNNAVFRSAKKYIAGKFKTGLGVNMRDISNSGIGKETEELIYSRSAALIKTIPQHILEDFKSELYSNVSNIDLKVLNQAYKKIGQVSARRAKFIARDQTAKMLENINMRMQEDLGIEYYMWRTSEDERVSTGKGGHKQLDGKIYRYDKPEAVINAYGDKGHPAERPNCRCIALGVILDVGEKLVHKGDHYEVVKA